MDDLEKRLRYEENRLIAWGWTRSMRQMETPSSHQIYMAEVWVDPVKFEDYTRQNAYARAVERLLKDTGWRNVMEIKRIGKAEWNKPLQKWGRYQSPSTKRLYSFLEAMEIAENNWSESIWPNGCSKNTRLLNDLVGENFCGDEVRTWLYQSKTKEHVFELW